MGGAIISNLRSFLFGLSLNESLSSVDNSGSDWEHFQNLCCQNPETGSVPRGGVAAAGRDRRTFCHFASRAVY